MFTGFFPPLLSFWRFAKCLNMCSANSRLVLLFVALVCKRENRGCSCCWQTWFPAWKGRYSLFYCGRAEWYLILFTDTWMQLPPPPGWIQTSPNETMKPWPTVLSQATRIQFPINSLSCFVLLPGNEYFYNGQVFSPLSSYIIQTASFHLILLMVFSQLFSLLVHCWFQTVDLL